ncbi:MAG: ABC transporter substrate-binding protein [Bacilli bacterium]|nr:ABC transporter substrate-binding protein [Bacilli bacterium]
MKKIILSVTLLVLFAVGAILISRDNSNKIKVAEVTHSVFYAPQYVADALGYFEDEGLDIEIILTAGADKVTAAVLSGDVQIGLCGSEATIYVYNQGEEDYLINFSALTKRDGSFLVSREKIDNFDVKMLEGKYILGGRQGGRCIGDNIFYVGSVITLSYE